MMVIRYDLRRPPGSELTASDQYAACLEQIKWAERVGFGIVTLSEHHGTEDGYMPAPLTLAAAIAAITTKASINISALLAIMHDPIRLAEQLAVLDIIAQGRLTLIAGTGYREEEFHMAGINFADRYKLLEESVLTMRKAWTGEYFDFRGRQVRVRPTPHTPGGPMLMLGGSTPVAARRAARLNTLFSPAVDEPEVTKAYYDECAVVGYRGYAVVPSADLPTFIHVTNDPERDWPRIAPHALFDAQTYSSWQRKGQSSVVHVKAENLDDIKASGIYCVMTPDQVVASVARTGILVMHPLMGGISPDLAAESLDLFEHQVLPRLNQAV